MIRAPKLRSIARGASRRSRAPLRVRTNPSPRIDLEQIEGNPESMMADLAVVGAQLSEMFKRVKRITMLPWGELNTDAMTRAYREYMLEWTWLTLFAAGLIRGPREAEAGRDEVLEYALSLTQSLAEDQYFNSVIANTLPMTAIDMTGGSQNERVLNTRIVSGWAQRLVDFKSPLGALEAMMTLLRLMLSMSERHVHYRSDLFPHQLNFAWQDFLWHTADPAIEKIHADLRSIAKGYVQADNIDNPEAFLNETWSVYPATVNVSFNGRHMRDLFYIEYKSDELRDAFVYGDEVVR